MQPKGWVNLIRICVLGALNGLLFGVAAEAIRVWYEKVEITRYKAQEQVVSPDDAVVFADFMEPSTDVGAILLCAIIFAGACHLVHRYYRGRYRPVLVIWQVVGLLAATVYAGLSFLQAPVHISRGLWWWAVCLAVVIPINFIYSLAVEAAVSFYTEGQDA